VRLPAPHRRLSLTARIAQLNSTAEQKPSTARTPDVISQPLREAGIGITFKNYNFHCAANYSILALFNPLPRWS
jgi:hypothetical protein